MNVLSIHPMQGRFSGHWKWNGDILNPIQYVYRIQRWLAKE